jgi:hypothetical protein
VVTNSRRAFGGAHRLHQLLEISGAFEGATDVPKRNVLTWLGKLSGAGRPGNVPGAYFDIYCSGPGHSLNSWL